MIGTRKHVPSYGAARGRAPGRATSFVVIAVCAERSRDPYLVRKTSTLATLISHMPHSGEHAFSAPKCQVEVSAEPCAVLLVLDVSISANPLTEGPLTCTGSAGLTGHLGSDSAGEQG